tara:strand:- start:1080 stop:1337 length:258 start_codon:yes stop_codon:yes gene_type:complete
MEVATMNRVEAIELLREEAHEAWVKEMKSLNWGFSGEATILDLLLSTYGMELPDAIEDILNSDKGEDMQDLIGLTKLRQRGIVNG